MAAKKKLVHIFMYFQYKI